SDRWEEITWDAAVAGIARHIKDTRDKTFVASNAKGEVVNRTPGIVMIGGCTDTNEVNWLQWKVSAALGVTYRDTETPGWHGPTVASLAATFGRGAMTNGWVDIKNSDVVFVMGGNPAENHPCGFKWALEAKKTRGAKIVSVDPRFQRTAAVADVYAPVRAGSDIAFL